MARKRRPKAPIPPIGVAIEIAAAMRMGRFAPLPDGCVYLGFRGEPDHYVVIWRAPDGSAVERWVERWNAQKKRGPHELGPSPEELRAQFRALGPGSPPPTPAWPPRAEDGWTIGPDGWATKEHPLGGTLRIWVGPGPAPSMRILPGHFEGGGGI